MILLIGMNTSLIKYPTAPMTAKPMAQEDAILIYSLILQLNTSSVGFGAFSKESPAVGGEFFDIFDNCIDSIDSFLTHLFLILNNIYLKSWVYNVPIRVIILNINQYINFDNLIYMTLEFKLNLMNSLNCMLICMKYGRCWQLI